MPFSRALSFFMEVIFVYPYKLDSCEDCLGLNYRSLIFFIYICGNSLPLIKMKTPFRNFQNFSSSLLVLVVVFFLFTLGVSAQFVVKKDFIVTLNDDVYTLEQENSFQSDLLGEGTLHFTGVSQQVSTSITTSLSDVAIHNASQLEIKNKLNITGDLNIISETLVLQHPLLMQGSIRLLNAASIQNTYLISYLFTEQIEHNTGTLVQNIQIPAYFRLETHSLVKYTTASLLLKKAPLYVAVHYRFDTAPPLSPPPEKDTCSFS